VRAPWIDGGTGPWSGEIRLYLHPEGPCYGCGQDEDARAISDDPRSCGAPSNGLPAGAAAPISATIGAHMALLAVRFLMGLSVPDGLLVFDGITGDLTHVRQQRDPTCPYHKPIACASPILLGSQHTVGALLAALGPHKTPLAWNPIQLRVECPHCGFIEPKPSVLSVAENQCSRCSTRLRSRTTLELTKLPLDVRLTDLGIPAQEILAVRTEAGVDFVELLGHGE
jgi:hypothetical protein